MLIIYVCSVYCIYTVYVLYGWCVCIVYILYIMLVYTLFTHVLIVISQETARSAKLSFAILDMLKSEPGIKLAMLQVYTHTCTCVLYLLYLCLYLYSIRAFSYFYSNLSCMLYLEMSSIYVIVSFIY